MTAQPSDESPAQREARLAAKRRYREQRRAELAAKQRKYYARNRNAVLAYHQEYGQRHRTQRAAYQKTYYDAHKEALLRQNAQWREANREAIRTRQNKYYQSHKEQSRRSGILRYCRNKYPDEIAGMSDDDIVAWHTSRMAASKQQRATAKDRRLLQSAQKRTDLANTAMRREQERQAAAERKLARRRRRELQQAEKANAEERRRSASDAAALRERAKRESNLTRAQEAAQRNEYWRQLHGRFIKERGWPQVDVAELSIEHRKTLSLHWRREKRRRVEEHILSHGSEDEKATVRSEIELTCPP